ncbi:MAG: methyl-accepting chemotaxis protein [Clostridiaceae bacterium]|nr:methyl-accepting chemotaxis protein [Clostridiaceae bacterium]
MSLRLKIIAICTILIILPTTFLGYTSYKNANEVLTNELQLASSQTVNRVIDTLDLFMDSMEDTLTTLSRDPNIQGLHSNPDSVERMLKTFEAVGVSHEDILHVYIGTPQQDMFIYPVTELPEGFDPTTRPWYRDAMTTDGAIWTEAYVDSGTGDLVISTARAVYHETTGEFIGVISLDVSLEILNQLLGSIQLGEEGYIILTDEDGLVMVHPDTNSIGSKIPIDNLLEAVSTQQQGMVDYQFEGDQRFGVFNTLDRTHWRVLGMLRYEEVRSNTSIILRDILINGIIALIVAILIAIVFSGKITRSLKTLVEDMKKIGGGDFTIRSNVQSKDEVGALAKTLSTMTQDLSSLVKSIQLVSTEVSASADTLAATAEETSASTEEVTRTVEEIAKGASEQADEAEKGSMKTNTLAEKFDELEASSEEMLQASDEAITANKKGLDVVEDLKEKNKKNNLSIAEIEKAVGDLDHKAQSIGAILQTISTIAEQTNLLALNAAIEAARAGEAGKGFAVVADEIRKLAEQSGRSTDEIREIITAIQQESNKTVGVMEQVKVQNKESDATVGNVGHSFEDISNAINIITNKIHHINDYVVTMARDKDEIVMAIEGISAVSEETAASSQEVTASMEQTSSAVEEIARASEGLNDLAEQLSNQVNKFKI